MKIADDEYVEWSTGVDEPVSEVVGWYEATCRWGEERIRWVDEHLCSCRARLGESVEIRNGRAVPVGGGRLAYHFESYDEVLAFMVDSHQPVKTVEHLYDLAASHGD